MRGLTLHIAKGRWANRALLLGLSLLLGACSQGRRSLLYTQNDEIWNAMPLCQNISGYQTLGCFQVQLDITQNMAFVDVAQLNFDPAKKPYRVLARRTAVGDSAFQLLADNVSTNTGGTVNVYAKAGHWIEQYDEWRIELTSNFDPTNFMVLVGPGDGLPVAHAQILWPELNSNGTR